MKRNGSCSSRGVYHKRKGPLKAAPIHLSSTPSVINRSPSIIREQSKDHVNEPLFGHVDVFEIALLLRDNPNQSQMLEANTVINQNYW